LHYATGSYSPFKQELTMASTAFRKKDTSIQVRMSSELKDELMKVAKSYNDTPAGLARFLVERFVEAHKKNGRLTYPPTFQSK
jgi:hypothetical protein